MTYTITHMLGHTHGTYTNHTDAHSEVLKLIPVGVNKSKRALHALAIAKSGSTVRVDYDGCEVSISVL